MQSKTLLLLACLLLFGPPLAFTCISLFLLFMVLTEPWGWLGLFLLLAVPMGTLLIGLILRATHKPQPMSDRHPGWQEIDEIDGEKRP
jgi:hypothetical protein